MKNNLRNFFRRLGKTRFMILCFILLAAISYYFNGRLGIVAAAIGWWLGSVIYDWKESKRRIKNFFRTNTNIKVKSIILIPTIAACVYYAGWLGLIGSIIGVIVGELICRKIFK